MIENSMTLPTTAQTMTSEALKDLILQHLEDKKAEKIVIIDLEKKSSIADYLLIASANSGRQAGAIADSIYRTMKDLGIKSHVEGVPQCDWVLIDAGDVIVHIFRPEVRSFYNLEKMWGMEIPAE